MDFGPQKKYNPEKHVFGKIPVTDKSLVYFSNLRHLGVSYYNLNVTLVRQQDWVVTTGRDSRLTGLPFLGACWHTG